MAKRRLAFGWTLFLAASAPLIVGCAPAQNNLAEAAPLTSKQLQIVETQLGGRVQGEAQRCIPNFQNLQTIRVSDQMLIYRSSGNLAYRNDLRGSCPGLARDSDVMVVRQFGSTTCAGDFFHLVDRSSGMRGPTCILGPFTPYRKEQGS